MGIIKSIFQRNKRPATYKDIRDIKQQVSNVPSVDEMQEMMDYIYSKESRRSRWESLSDQEQKGALYELFKMLRSGELYGSKKR